MSSFRNIMNIIQFQKQLAPYQIFSLRDIEKLKPDFSYRQLDRWEKQGYLQKIKQGFYAFPRQDINEIFQYLVANKIYRPSYISLEKAMKFYGFIPEEVFQITSVSTKKTVSFHTPVGEFGYRHIKPSLFWGYHIIEKNASKILLAEPEKAVLDYLYLNPHWETVSDFREMRINKSEFERQASREKFLRYAMAFRMKALLKRAESFLLFIDSND